MRANLAAPSVAAVSLAKSDVGAGFVAPAPFIVSRGTLPTPTYHPALDEDGGISVGVLTAKVPLVRSLRGLSADSACLMATP